MFKKVLKKIIPPIIIYTIRIVLAKLKSIRARMIFNKAAKNPQWLTVENLETLQTKYPYPPEYGYDADSLKKRGIARASEILDILNKKTRNANNLQSFLELGCWDGMTSCALKHLGKTTTGVDIKSDGFDKRALQAGVTLKQMDACKMDFPDENFDIVFSYDAFEHFPNPEAVLKEMIRITKTNGYIFMFFDPLYMSPMGLHAYRSITVPYCQFLFPEEVLQNFTNFNNLDPINSAKINKRSLRDYRHLWKKYSSQLKKIFYQENYNTNYMDLIIKHPTCFKSKTEYFDNLIVSGIKVLFKKNINIL